MNKSLCVYAIGNAIMDFQLQIEEEALRAKGLPKGEMRLVEEQDQQLLLSQLAVHEPHRASGGSAANTIISLAQLGKPVGFGCCVGEDEIGRQYIDEMSSLGVEIHARQVKGAHTGTSVVLITPDAERTMNTHLGASSTFDSASVSEDAIARSEWVYLEGYLLATETGRSALKEATRLARQQGAKIALTFSDGFIVENFRAALEDLLGDCELVFANRNEACHFAKTDDEDAAFEAICSAVPNAVMTLHERGAKIKFANEVNLVSSYEVKAIDETGAGDMFAGAFLYGITSNMSGEQSGRLACFFASLVVSQLGPRLNTDLRKLLQTGGFEA